MEAKGEDMEVGTEEEEHEEAMLRKRLERRPRWRGALESLRAKSRKNLWSRQRPKCWRFCIRETPQTRQRGTLQKRQSSRRESRRETRQKRQSSRMVLPRHQKKSKARRGSRMALSRHQKKSKAKRQQQKHTIKAELEFSVDEMRLDNERSRSHYLLRTGLIGAPRGQGSRVFPYDMSKRDSVKAAKQRAVAEALRICKERGVTTKPKFVQ